MKTIADLLETGSFQIKETTFDGIECYALLVETPLGLSYQISAVMI